MRGDMGRSEIMQVRIHIIFFTNILKRETFLQHFLIRFKHGSHLALTRGNFFLVNAGELSFRKHLFLHSNCGM